MIHALPALAAGGGAPVLAAAPFDSLPEPLRSVAEAGLSLDRLTVAAGDALEADLRAAFARALPELRALLAGLSGGEATLTRRIDAVALAAAEADIAEILGDAGLVDAVSAHAQAHADTFAAAIDAVEAAGLPRTAVAFDGALVETLVAADVDRWLLYGERLADVARDAVLDNATVGRTLGQVVDAVGEAMGGTLPEAARDARTMLAGYNRRVADHIAEANDLDHFLYVGPLDGITRPFCAPLVGKVLTRDQIGALANGQIEPPMTWGGGFNCRHHWQPVPPPRANWPRPSAGDLADADQGGAR